MFKEGQEPIFEPESVPPVPEEIVEAETKDLQAELFRGQEAEVTVERNLSGGKKKPEGGWVVVGPGNKPGTTKVERFGSGEYKFVNTERLLGLQSFQVGESAPVVRSDGRVDTEGWTIKGKTGFGGYLLEKVIGGKPKQKMAEKTELITAQQRKLQEEIYAIEIRVNEISAWGDLTGEDRDELRRLDSEKTKRMEIIEYWEQKRRVCEELKRKDQKSREQQKPAQREEETEGDILEGRTPEGF